MRMAGESPSIAKPLLVMLALMAGISATGLQLYRHYDRETREDAQNLVTAVAQQKAQTLEIWLDGRASAANQLRTAPALRESVAQLVTRRDAKALPRIRQLLHPERWDMHSALLLNVQGALLVSVGSMDQVSAELRERVRVTAASGETQLHFLHRDRDAPGSPIVLDYLVPLAAPEGGAGPLAVLVLRHDPELFFFPLIQSWPAQSRSAETLLVRREEDHVLFLNTLRHQADTAFRLTRLRTEATLPAAQAVFGLPRLEKNFDYRGIEVMYDHRPIRGTGWHVVGKIDAAEILHATKHAATAALAITLAFILVVGASATVFWRQQLRLFAAGRHAAKLEREALSKHLDLMSRHANDAIFLYDDAGRILEANERAVERYGYPRDELIGMSANQLRGPEVAREARAVAREADQAGSGIYETLHRRKDGSEFPVEVSLVAVEVDGTRFTQGIIRDITLRKHSEQALIRQKDLYQALSQTNQTIVRGVSREELFQSVCRIAVEQGRFLFAWIALVSEDRRWLRPVAKYGSDDGYMAALHTAMSDRSMPKRGLSWRAVDSGAHTVANDFLTDPETAPWHDAARRRGVGAFAAFPIRRTGNVVGVINVYAGTSGFFTDDLLATLDEMAIDVSFALDNIEREAERTRAVGALRERESQYRQLFEANPHPMWVHDLDTLRFLAVNDAAVAHYGYTRDEFDAMTLVDIRPPEEVPRLMELVGYQANESVRDMGVARHRKKDGTIIDVEIVTHMLDFGGRRARVVLANDVTERLRAARELVESEERFRGLVEQSIAGIYIIQDDKFAYANRRFAEIFHYASADELIGRDPLALVTEKDRELSAEYIRRRLDGDSQNVNYGFTGQCKDGSLVEVGLNSARATYKGRPAIVGLMQDISEKKRAEEEIQRYVVQLETAFMSTVEVATTLSEMRDPYTAGHERRVAEIAVAIAAELGFDPGRLEGVRVAGHLHDIGKITIPTEILAKPGKLTALEFQLIKGHVQASYDVLKDVKFPWPVAQVALQHHERMDGSGYPQGLKGDAILLEARITAVADVIEAMSSHRPYRPGLGIEKALAEIERGSGTSYDSNVADACLRLFREMGYQLPA